MTRRTLPLIVSGRVLAAWRSPDVTRGSLCGDGESCELPFRQDNREAGVQDHLFRAARVGDAVTAEETRLHAGRTAVVVQVITRRGDGKEVSASTQTQLFWSGRTETCDADVASAYLNKYGCHDDPDGCRAGPDAASSGGLAVSAGELLESRWPVGPDSVMSTSEQAEFRKQLLRIRDDAAGGRDSFCGFILCCVVVRELGVLQLIPSAP